MKFYRSALLGLALAAAAAAPAHGQSVRANVPFDFLVGNQVLPAGEYVVSSEGSGNTSISIRSTEGHGTVLAVALTCAEASPTAKSRLIFHAVGGRYFLSQVWASGRASGRQLPKSQAETELAKAQQPAKDLVIAARLAR